MNLTTYLLTQFASEASEVAHATSKCIQFGCDDVYLNKRADDTMLQEYMELRAVAVLLDRLGVPTSVSIIRETCSGSEYGMFAPKWERVLKFAGYSNERGILDIEGYRQLENIVLELLEA